MQTEFRTKKSAQTFEKILAAATELFRTRGFHGATMRDLAQACGMGLGALYYYFRSKEDLVQLFYAEHSRQTLDAWRSRNDLPRTLPEAVAEFTRMRLERMVPYKDLLRVVMKEAVDPTSPLCPLHPASAQTLDENIGLFVELVERSGTARGREALDLARGLWLGQMGILIYWLHDRSPNGEATRRAVQLYSSIVRFTTLRIPGLSALRRQFLDLLAPLFEREKRINEDEHLC